MTTVRWTLSVLGRTQAVTLLLLSPIVSSVTAQQSVAPPVRGTIALALDGLDIEFDDTGNWVRMSSTYRQPVNFPDRAGLRRAYTIAEERGKAQIIRYFEENVTSERVIQEVNSEVQTAQRTQVGGSSEVTRTTQRKMVESITEFTRSYSRGTLRGVTIIEQGYDEAAEEVWVKIGLSRASVSIGTQIQNDVANPVQRGSRPDSAGGNGLRPGEVRTRKIPQ